MNLFTKKLATKLKKIFIQLFIFLKTILPMCLFGNQFNSEIELLNKETTKK